MALSSSCFKLETSSINFFSQVIIVDQQIFWRSVERAIASNLRANSKNCMPEKLHVIEQAKILFVSLEVMQARNRWSQI